MSTLKLIPKPCMMKMAEGTGRTIRLVDINNKEEIIMTLELEDYLYSKHCIDSSTYFEDTEKEFLNLLRAKRIIYINGCYGFDKKKKKVKKIFVVYFNCWAEDYSRFENICSFKTLAQAEKFVKKCKEEADKYLCCKTNAEKKMFLDLHPMQWSICLDYSTEWEYEIDEIELE